MFYHSSQNPSLLPTPSPFPTKDHLGLQLHFCHCPLCHCGCPHATGMVLHPDPHDARMSGSLVPPALGAVLGTGQRHRTGICSSDGGTRGAAGPCLSCLGRTEDPRQVWEGRMGSALLSPGTARGGSWDRHPSSLLSWPGCPADGHHGDHAEGATCSPSPLLARVAKQPCSPLHVWDRGTWGHGQVTHTHPPPACQIEGSGTQQPRFGLGGYSHSLLSPARSRASSYLFLHIVLQFLFSTLFVPFVSCLAELHVLGAAHWPAHWASPAQPGPKCQLLKEMP